MAWSSKSHREQFVIALRDRRRERKDSQGNLAGHTVFTVLPRIQDCPTF